MLPSEELLQSIDILAQNAVKDSVKIYTAIVTSVGDNNTCSVHVNGKTHSNIAYYGDVPTVNKSYRVFCPNGSMNQAFIITGGGSSGGGSTGATDYNQLTNRPSINGTTLSGNQTSSQLGLYGTNNAPPYPVTSVNGQTGNVVISTGGGTADAVEWNNVLDKPTTIAGYGITDAKIDNGTITLGDKTITPLTSAPVISVNNKMGNVVLTSNDIGINYKLTKNEDNSLNLVWSE